MNAKLLSALVVIGLAGLIDFAAVASELHPPFNIPTGDLPERPPFGVPPELADVPPFGPRDGGLGMPPELGMPDFDVPPELGPPADTPPSGLPDGGDPMGDVVTITRTDADLTLTMNHPRADLLGLNEPFLELHLVFGEGAPDRTGPFPPDGPFPPLGTSLDAFDLGGGSDLVEPPLPEGTSLADSSTSSSALVAAAPEPSSLLLVVLGAGLILFRTRSTRF